MSSACPDCTSRTRCVNHAGDVARRSVDSYVPKALRTEDWEPIASFTRALAHDLHPKDDRRAVEVMRTLSQVVSWAHRDGLPLDRERIFTPDVIDRYIAVGAAHLSEPSRATRRADLRRFSRSLTRKAPWEPEPPRMRGGYSIVPYTDDEVINQIVATDPGSTILGFVAPRWDRSRLSHLLQRAELPADCPPLRTHRLRATWALAHLRAGVPLNDIMQLAGVSSWKMLGYLAPFAPSSEWSELLPRAVRK